MIGQTGLPIVPNFENHRMSTAVKPHTTLRNVLMHPKDIMGDENEVEVVYKIPCKNCDQSYKGETGRPL